MRHKLAMLAHDEIDPRLLELLVDVQEEAVAAGREGARAHAARGVGARGRAQRLARRARVRDGWELAPVFVGGRHRPRTSSTSSAAGARRRTARRGGALARLHAGDRAADDEITDSVTRISTLVAAAKQYSHMDRAPFERVDMHDGLKSTLAMLAGKLARDQGRQGLRPDAAAGPGLRRRAQPGLDQPDRQRGAGDGRRRHADAAHRRWTATTSGSRSATPGRASRPSCASASSSRSSPPSRWAQGTGLGLDISYRIVVARHGGDLTVQSTPGDTLHRAASPDRALRPRDPAHGVVTVRSAAPDLARRPGRGRHRGGCDRAVLPRR